MHSRATDRRSASKCQGKWPDQTLHQAFGLPEVLVAVSTSRLSCKRAGKTRTLMPVWDSSGESRLKARAITIPSSRIRFHADLKHPDGTRWPVMVVPIINAAGLFCGVQRTFLMRDGKAKAALDPNKLTLGP